MSDVYLIEPIAVVRSPRRDLSDDDWGRVESVIELVDALPADSLDGIEAFSHIEVLFVFDQVNDAGIERSARRPRGNPAWPRVGIFAQRAKGRPNRLGATVVRVRSRAGRRIHVEGLDAVDGTPVVDIKPVMRGFLPRTPVVEPDWAREIMREYWTTPPNGDAVDAAGDDAGDVRRVIATWHRATADGDVDRVLQLMDEHAVFLVAGQPPMAGRAAFGTGLRAILRTHRIESNVEMQEVRVSGDLAYSWAMLTVRVTSRVDDGVVVVRKGAALSVFARDLDGRWRLIRDANMLTVVPS